MNLIKLFLIASTALLGNLHASESDFLSLCKVTIKSADKTLCTEVQNKLFKGRETQELVYISPDVVGAPVLALDNKIDYIAFNDPNLMSGVAYCYFVYKNWISMTKMSPDLLGMSATGFSILQEDLKGYQKWLSSSHEANKCKEYVKKESEVTVSNLETYLKGKVAIIGLNPFASINIENPTMDSTFKDMKVTIVHERIHAYQATCKSFDDWSMKEWQALPVKEKNQYINKYPTYTWSIPKVAAREYVGFKYEESPEKLESYLKACH